jgi:hypothetical protein
MEQINTIELSDETIFPDEQVLQRVLGDSYTAYTELLALFGRLGMTHEWRYYRDGKAWLCKAQKKKRTIIWMSAWKGYMQATIYFPGRLLDGLYALDLNEETKERFEGTKNVGQSKPAMFEIRDHDILKDLETVIQYKLASR